MQKTLSISVAAYNVEKYLVKLVESVVRSKYRQKVELLIINDGSTDHTRQIAEDYQSKYPNIVRLINKENGGHGSTINVGIQKAVGKYFRALDGDDWVDTDSLDKIILELDKYNADVIISDYWKCYEDADIVKSKVDIIPSKEIMKINYFFYLKKRVPYQSVIYRTAILQKNNICLDEHCFYEDTEYTTYPFAYACSIAYIPLPLYCYRLGREGQSVNAESRKKHIVDSTIVLNSLMLFYKKNSQSTLLRTYILQNVISIYCWYIDTMLLFSPRRDWYLKIKLVEKRILSKEPDVYAGAEKDLLVKRLRKTKYSYYYLFPINNTLWKIKTTLIDKRN